MGVPSLLPSACMAHKPGILGWLDRLQQSHKRHKKRHRPTGFGYALTDDISMVRPDHWDAVVAHGSVCLGRPYLETMARHGPPKVTYRQALIYRGRRPVAAVSTQLIEIAAGQVIDGAAFDAEDTFADTTAKISKAALERIRPRVMICGDLLTWGPCGVALVPDEEPGLLWSAVAEALYRIRRADRLHGQVDYILVKDFPAGERHSEALRTYSYRPLATEPDMVLELPAQWQSYDDYLKHLKTKYRKAARRLARQVDKAGCVVAALSDLEPHADRLYQLYQQVEQRASVRLASMTPTFLPALSRALGPEQFRCSVIRRGQEILGFATTLRDRRRAVGYYLGLDYATNAEIPLYLRLLQAVVADAIALGGEVLSLGRTALEPKARLGAKPVPQQIWVRHRMPVINVVVRELLQVVPHDEAPERSPFKAG